jgi:hypothetical protein
MSFEPIRAARGQPMVRCTCGDCGRDEVVRAIHGKNGHQGDGQAAAKIQKLGWTYIGKHLRCRTCEAKRKVAKVSRSKKVVSVVSTAPREPTRAQKRAIMDLLNEVYDTDEGCYCQGDTDDTVADVLKVLPGWVIQLREEFYGPSGGNEELLAMAADLKAFLEIARPSLQAHQKQSAVMVAAIEKAEGFLKRLVAIEKAVGPRVMAQAK